MRMIITYNIVVNDIIVETSRSFKKIIDAWKEISKSEPNAWIQTCYD